MRRLTALILAGWLCCAASARAEPGPSAQNLLDEARHLASVYGERIWPGFSGASFAVLLLYPQHDVLSCARAATADFQPRQQPYGASCDQWIRSAGSLPRSSQLSMFLDGIPGPVIVTGTPLETSASPGSWVLTMLHEHFHQMQMTRPGYQKGTKALGLSNGDETGMWMLDYPFPYDDWKVGKELSGNAHDLAMILQETDKAEQRRMALLYAQIRPNIMAQLSANDRKYAELQLWQEGVARYTELRFAGYAAAAQEQGWQSPVDYAALELNLRDNLIHQLQTADLQRDRRDIFYPLGAAESLVLDIIDPHWHSRYFGAGYSMAPLFAAAIKPSGS